MSRPTMVDMANVSATENQAKPGCHWEQHDIQKLIENISLVVEEYNRKSFSLELDEFSADLKIEDRFAVYYKDKLLKNVAVIGLCYDDSLASYGKPNSLKINVVAAITNSNSERSQQFYTYLKSEPQECIVDTEEQMKIENVVFNTTENPMPVDHCLKKEIETPFAIISERFQHKGPIIADKNVSCSKQSFECSTEPSDPCQSLNFENNQQYVNGAADEQDLALEKPSGCEALSAQAMSSKSDSLCDPQRIIHGKEFVEKSSHLKNHLLIHSSVECEPEEAGSSMSDGPRKEAAFSMSDVPRKEASFRTLDGPRKEASFSVYDGPRKEDGSSMPCGPRKEAGFSKSDGPDRDKRVETSKKPFACDVCGECFFYANQLRTHLQIHSDEKTFKCDICRKRFKTQSKLKFHKLIHTAEKPFSCETCDKRFRHASDLKTHARTHTGIKPFRCETCGKCFGLAGNLKVHLQSHTTEKSFKSEISGKGANKPGNVQSHLQTQSSDASENSSTELEDLKPIHRKNGQGGTMAPSRNPTRENGFNCKTCGKEFNQLSALEMHKNIHTGDRPFQCDICGKGFGHSSNLTRHLQIHYSENAFKCNICQKCFRTERKLQAHISTHMIEMASSCETCGKQFNQSCNPNMHENTLDGDQRFECAACEKRYKQQQSIKVHQRTRKRSYQCDICDKQFNQASVLNMHKKIHTGEKPYTCEVCKKGFNHPSNLTRHLLIHSGTKDYKCDICGKGFYQSGDLKRHVQTHSKEMQVECYRQAEIIWVQVPYEAYRIPDT